MSLRSRLGKAALALLGKDAGWTMTLGAMELMRDVFAMPTRSGKVINEQTALQFVTVLAIVLRIAFGVAQVPWKLFKYLPDNKGKQEAREHPLWRILHRKPNAWQTSFQFRVTMMLHLLLTGAFYAFVNRVRGEIVEILPLEPGKVTVERIRGTWDLRYFMTGDDGTRREIPKENIWHLRGPSWNGWQGLETVKLVREAIGLGMAAQDAQIDMQKRSGKIPGVLALEGNVPKESYADLSTWLRTQAQKDIEETGVMMIDKAAKFYAVAMTAVESQTIETRKLQIEELCRAWGLMPVMIGHPADMAARAALSEIFVAHVVHTLDPHMVNIEQSAETELLSEDEQKEYSIAFIRAGLMRGAPEKQAEMFARALGQGATGKGQAWMKVNEVRDALEMNPIDGGDEIYDPTPAAVPPGKPADKTQKDKTEATQQ